MTEQENPPIQITEHDIQVANKLSEHCPICASAVEANVTHDSLIPVVCEACGTLYHKSCWGQGGGKCAVLGCDHTKYRVHGTKRTPTLKLSHNEIPQPVFNGRSAQRQTQRLKNEQRQQVEELRRPNSFWRRLWQWLLDQIKIG